MVLSSMRERDSVQEGLNIYCSPGNFSKLKVVLRSPASGIELERATG